MSSEVVAHHFDDAEQQRESATVGMWTFLATEVLFFGVLFTAFATYRVLYTDDFREASGHLFLWIGAVNTFVLLTSSLAMALAVHAAATGSRRGTVGWLCMAVALGIVFLGFKGFEYYKDYQEQLVPALNFHYEGPANPFRVQMFMVIYFIMTGLHAVHVIVGVGVLSCMAWMAHRRRFSPAYYTPVEISGLYWHFVDIVWIFLFPLLYLTET